jgi:hypothetical protein
MRPTTSAPCRGALCRNDRQLRDVRLGFEEDAQRNYTVTMSAL